MFPTDSLKAADDHDSSVITPLGRVVMTVDDGVSTVGDGAPDDARALPRGGWLLTYRVRPFEARLLLGDVSPRLPPGMHVERCVAGVWRVRASEPVPALRFRCRCVELPAYADGGPSAGEGLDAQTWEVPGWIVSVGTQDGEFLSSRAGRGDNMPRALSDQLHWTTVEYTSNGLCVPLTNVPTKEVIQVHFLVAWAVQTETENEPTWNRSTWFAVDQESAWIVAELTSETG